MNIGKDEYSKLFFEILYMISSNDVDDLKDLCSKNPEKCRKKRPDLCKKILTHLGYKCGPGEDFCKIYVELSTFFVKKRKSSFIPQKASMTQTVLKNISKKGSDNLKSFMIKNDFILSERSTLKLFHG